MDFRSVFLAAALLIISACGHTDYYHIEDGRIVREGAPCYFIGTNMWYATQLAVEDRGRLCAELDSLKSLGIWNLRILATDENWEGLDITFDELRKRDMAAVLYLNNAWEWTPDGYCSYLEKATGEHQPHPAVEGYSVYMPAMASFAKTPEAVRLYQEHVRRVVTRYAEEPAVFSWQLCNEPRPFQNDAGTRESFTKYIQGTAELIKSLDPNHMVSTGNEGAMGCCDGDIDLFKSVHDCPYIDYLTIHIWPYNWSWVREDTVDSGVDGAITRIGEYINNHLSIAYQLRKPVVVEEFGYPRDGFEYVNTGSTAGRDAVYEYVFGRVVDSAKEGGRLAGCNFWTWSGLAEQTPGHQFWQEGDDLCGDPSQEAQGLNGVYLSDTTTLDVIRKATSVLDRTVSVFAPYADNWLQTGDGPFCLNVCLSSATPMEVAIKVDVVSDLSLMSAVRDTVFSLIKEVDAKAGCVDEQFELPLAPGFYQVSLRIGKPHSDGLHWFPAGVFNIGFNPEQTVSPQDRPEDFDAFWEETLAELAAVPMDVQMVYEPEHSNDLRRTYTVTFKSFGGETAGGRLCVPTAEGKHRTFIDYMGYGADPFWYDPSAAPDDIEFLVSVRDQGIFKDEGLWADRGMDSKENYYYRGAFCDVVRAIDFLCSLEEVDQDRLFARGESQGGAFTWLSASLDHRVDAIAPAVPFLCDYEDYAKIVWWPMWEMYEHAGAEGIERRDLHGMLRYFDVKNFTDRVECPVLMAFGLQDPTCPPHTNFSAYNLVNSEKSYYCVPTCDHKMWLESSWQQKRAAFFDSIQ